MVPFAFLSERRYDANAIEYTKMTFFNYNSDTTYEKVYYYPEKQIFWIADTDEVLTWQVL